MIEFVSARSGRRDYEDKPDEYLISGVGEYWIVDGIERKLTALTRYRGQWRLKVLKPTQKYATHLLPGFSLDLKRVFGAGA